MTKVNCETVRSAGTRYFFLSMSGISDLGSFSQITGTRSGYLLRIRSASSLRFSRGCSALNEFGAVAIFCVFATFGRDLHEIRTSNQYWNSITRTNLKFMLVLLCFGLKVRGRVSSFLTMYVVGLNTIARILTPIPTPVCLCLCLNTISENVSNCIYTW